MQQPPPKPDLLPMRDTFPTEGLL